jgi:hypothetical protein
MPFPKQSASVEVVELDDDDLVVLADVADEAPEHLARTIPRSVPSPSASAPSPAAPTSRGPRGAVPAPRFATSRPLPLPAPVFSPGRRSSTRVPVHAPPSARASGSFVVPKPTPPPPAAARPSAALSASSIPTPVRFTRAGERLEDDVAGECLATIASSRPTRQGPAGLRMPPPRDLDVPFDFDDYAPAAPSPAAAPPPLSFALAPVAAPAPRPSVPWARESRTSAEHAYGASSSSSSQGVALAGSAGSASSYDSLPPVASSRAPEPTVIVLREKPRTAWIAASAVVGALCAVAAMRLVTVRAPVVNPTPSAAAVAPVPEAAPASHAVARAATVAPAAAPRASASPEPPPPTIVRFDDAQGIAIVMTPPAPAPRAVPEKPERSAKDAAPAPSTSAPASAPTPTIRVVKVSPPTLSSAGPRLPDGSYGLGGSDTGPAPSGAHGSPVPSSSPATSPAALSGAAGAPKKRPSTPDPQLAEAQLKASMR